MRLSDLISQPTKTLDKYFPIYIHDVLIYYLLFAKNDFSPQNNTYTGIGQLYV